MHQRQYTKEELKDIDKALKTNDIKKPTEFVDKPKSKNMGMGPLISPNTIFVRQFRWTLEGKELKEHWTKSVNFDFVGKQIFFDAYQVSINKEDINIIDWSDNIGDDEVLRFTTYDGCGKPIYQYSFSGIKLIKHTSEFDYASSDEGVSHIGVSYKEMKRDLLLDKKAYVKHKYRWKATVLRATDKKELVKDIPVEIKARPNVKIEETEINHLNAKTWIPGKATWDNLTIGMDVEAKKELLTHLMRDDWPIIVLGLYDWNDVLIETYQLNNTKVYKVEQPEQAFDFSCQTTIRFSSVEYKLPKTEEKKKGNVETVLI